ncbi:hypothetical protein HK405_008012 [Cladochytrium tenue]|nr:hypothetical protein HK405_008012 [Cladochytrium tenue]
MKHVLYTKITMNPANNADSDDAGRPIGCVSQAAAAVMHFFSRFLFAHRTATTTAPATFDTQPQQEQPQGPSAAPTAVAPTAAANPPSPPSAEAEPDAAAVLTHPAAVPHLLVASDDGGNPLPWPHASPSAKQPASPPPLPSAVAPASPPPHAPSPAASSATPQLLNTASTARSGSQDSLVSGALSAAAAATAVLDPHRAVQTPSPVPPPNAAAPSRSRQTSPVPPSRLSPRPAPATPATPPPQQDLNEVRESVGASIQEGADGATRLNQYIMGDGLGRGSFGSVSRAEDPDAGRVVAIKEIDAKRLSRSRAAPFGPTARGAGIRGRGRGGAFAAAAQRSAMDAAHSNPIDLVRGEIAIMKKLRHPNVVRLYEVLYDPDQNTLYMVYELCGKPLMDVSLERPTEPYDEDKARGYFRQMLLGIEYHNLLVGSDGVMKIVDFGVSEMFSHGNDMSKSSAGSPALHVLPQSHADILTKLPGVAPQPNLEKHGELSAKATDIWAMGVTLYCMLYGVLPFTGKSVVDLYEAIRSNDVPFPADDRHSSESKDLLLKL